MAATSTLDVQANFGLRLPTMGHVSAGYFYQAHLVHYIHWASEFMKFSKPSIFQQFSPSSNLTGTQTWPRQPLWSEIDCYTIVRG